MREDSRGTVYLVGAGPGDPDLLTMRAHRLLRSADAVFHDDLVPQPVLELCRPGARIASVGKRCGVKAITQEQINAMLIGAARSGEIVVRLKSGDPLLYGRASEELAALGTAGIPCEVVPGVTAVFAAAAGLRVSLTDRFAASKLIVLTGHTSPGATDRPLWKGDLPRDATIAIYMPGAQYGSIAEALLAAGLLPETPCAVVSHAGTREQDSLHTTLSALQLQNPLASPSLILVGWTLERRVVQHAILASLAAPVPFHDLSRPGGR